MSATSIVEHDDKKDITDDISLEEVQKKESLVNELKMAELKAKSAAKQEENRIKENMGSKIVGQKEKALSLACIGAGQGGSRLSAVFGALGYPACAINTAATDLKFINLPDSSKLLLSYGPGGASKSLDLGHAAAEHYRGEIMQLINDKMSLSDINVCCLTTAGGSGAGAVDILVDCLSEVGKPIIVICVLPMDSDDTISKNNSLTTLAKLANHVKSKKIANLICVDNAKIESLYSHVGSMSFFDVANKAIIEPLDAFNTLSAMASSSKGIDPMELTKLLIDGDGLSTYGVFEVKNYKEDTAIAEAVISNLGSSLLCDLDISKAKYVGFALSAPQAVWDKIPSSSVTYASSMVNDICTSENVFRGMYVVDSNDDFVTVHSYFTGLSLPEKRVNQLKEETKQLNEKSKIKEQERHISLKIDTGTDEHVSAAQKIKEKIAAKSSTFGKFINSSVVDRRNK